VTMAVTSKPAPSAPLQPMGASGAAAFYQRHARATFLEEGYGVAPPRIQAALAEEIEFLRHALPGMGRALELGCGHGRLLDALRDCAAEWVGVDFLKTYLHDARRRLSPPARLAAGRGSGLPFADAVFDAVVCAQNTLGLMGEEKLPAMREAARVTRRGGRLLCVVYSESSVVSRTEWYAAMHARGLMAPLDWARSGPELLVTEDGHASECFRRERLEELFREAGLVPRIERLGEVYWTVQATVSSRTGCRE